MLHDKIYCIIVCVLFLINPLILNNLRNLLLNNNYIYEKKNFQFGFKI